MLMICHIGKLETMQKMSVLLRLAFNFYKSTAYNFAFAEKENVLMSFA